MGTDLLTNPAVYGPFAVIGLLSTVIALVLAAVVVHGWLADRRKVRREVRAARREMRQLGSLPPAWMREGL